MLLVRSFSPLAANVRASESQRYEGILEPARCSCTCLVLGTSNSARGGGCETGRLMGVEYRYPLLDLEVVEAALQLPWWACRRDGWDRIAFRLAVEPWVPRSVAWNTAKYEPALWFPPKTDPVPRPLHRQERGPLMIRGTKR